MLRRRLLFYLAALGCLAGVSALYAGTQPQHAQNSSHVRSQCCNQEAVRNSGAIAGQVLNAEGQPEAGIRVQAANAAFAPRGSLPVAVTDEEGKFRIEGLAPGTYNLYTENEELGYPFSMYAFTNLDPWNIPQATVYEGQTTSDVVIQLGPRAAILIIRIMDSLTGTRLRNAHITLRRLDNPTWRYSTQIHSDRPQPPEGLRILVPPIPFTIEVSAPRYQRWQYRRAGSNNQADALQLAPGSTHRLDIALRPIR